MNLTGRTVLITGASSGLGEHFARLMAANGATVVAAARRKDRLEHLVAELPAYGPPHLAVAMDVTDEASVVAAFDEAERFAGPIHTVLANAGISAAGSATGQAVSDFDMAFSVNVRGAFLAAREAARRVIARADGTDARVVLTASIGGLTPLPGLAAYSASKAAMVMLGKCLAREWVNKGIAVNVICPGYIRTDLNAEWFDSPGGQRQIDGFPRKRLMQATDLDDIVLALSGAGSSAITGSVFTLDDGQTL